MTEHQAAQVRQLSEWLDPTDIALLELTGPGTSIRLHRRQSDTAASGGRRAFVETPSEAAAVVRAGSVGIALRSHPLRTQPLIEPGQQVQAGQTLALLKIGLVLLPVPAPRAGMVRRVIAAHEAPVGYGDPLVELV
jgi:acetyl-CoA carboxylase biotin carboxyl carrier protein